MASLTAPRSPPREILEISRQQPKLFYHDYVILTTDDCDWLLNYGFTVILP